MLPPIDLERRRRLLSVRSSPDGAGITVDGTYRGTTPTELTLTPGREHRLRVFKIGFGALARTVRVASGQETAVRFDLPA